MLTLDDEGGNGAALAGDLHRRLAGLGLYEPERRAWLPHLTVVRFRERPRLDPGIPALGGSCRPTPLSTIHCCDPQGRSTW